MAEKRYKKIVYRDSGTGQFIPKKKAERDPEGTEKEVVWVTVKKKKK